MRLIDSSNAETYLRETAHIAPAQQVRASELAGGVSNMVLLMEPLAGSLAPFVLKQARPQLRTRLEWFSNVERNWREAEVLRICADLLQKRVDLSSAGATGVSPVPAARTPSILFEDRDNYLFGMTAAPMPHTTWKSELLEGRVDAQIAAACGRLLGTLHAESWLDEDVRTRLGDRTLFDQLRIDPYYRTLAIARPETRPAVERVIAALESHPRSLVHADFSPKNLLLFSGGMMMVDFETGHYGDPAFDLGFFLSHLVLKACLQMPRHETYLDLTAAFGRAYDEVLAVKVSAAERSNLWRRGIQNFALCAWARLDGKSPVEYLSEEGRRERIRVLCRVVLDTEPTTWREVITLTTNHFAI